MDEIDEKTQEAEIDAQLVLDAAKGEEQAFTMIYNRYRLPLYAFLKRRLDKNACLDDLFQQIWLKVYDNLPKYQEQYRFSSWLFRIAQNHLIDYFRGQKRSSFEEIEEYQAVTQENSLNRIENAEQTRDFHEALAQLPSNQQELINLRNQGYSFKEIADMKGLSINTVLGWRHYAVRNLKKYLKSKEEGELI